LKSKDEFLSILSHELRQPLNAVLGWTRILLARSEPDPDLTARALQVIGRNATAQAAMIDDILDVARIAAGKLRLEMQPTDLTHVVLAAIDASLPALEAKGITLRTNLEEDGLLVLGDPTRLQQIVWNLLSNAVKFTGHQGAIEVSLTGIGSIVRLTVEDTGCGINAAFLPFVFDRFRQSDASSSRRQGGLGLGLALVRDLVSLHGGVIRASSAGENRGATFTIDLPATAVERRWSPSQRDPSWRRAPSLTGVRALVVDDETDSRELLVAALTRCGADVVAASSSEEALRLLQEVGLGRQLDVIVSDIGMPKEDGFELMRRVRAMPASEGGAIPAVAVTAYSTPDDRMLALSTGFQLHVAKPIDPLAVASAVERVLRRANSSAS
jgi:CheY-like chemotaxis protein